MTFSIKDSSILFFASALLLQGALGDEDLSTNVCAFAISTSGKRCLLENSAGRNGKVEYQFCSPACNKNCDNIVDLYFHLAAGEGVFLPELCKKQKNGPHRTMIELSSNGAADEDAAAPAPN
ncbi:hypothetical protein MTR67_045306 [Solanum verrucosum]|uniref:Secreted protein n=1 Tax=Solanum verrucosum TaxID=315347 RepID=A0AAF0UV56_SOLVR|nr:hypothetical protein MTR67_045306 [Solanum verrucosum]